MGLVLKNKITVSTQLGTSEIQLLFGDITQLPLEDKVDFIFVSAFPGDYTPVPGTLIGALRRNLELDVGKVAKDKASDLRKSFNCWVSKPLSDDVPYRRLVCFERMNRFEKLAEQISGMFRAMMPVFQDQDTSVITPLLASGNQGHSEVHVLKAIVPAACHWIKAGLPLGCLKIVVFAKNPHAVSRTSQELLENFDWLKKKWESKQSMQIAKVEKSIDVCLSYCGGDEEYVGQVCESLRKMHTEIVIHKEEFAYDYEAVWQEKIFTVMSNSRKIIALLTPNYVVKPECLEQFNLALCCNRLTGMEVLAPFYVQTVDNFPSYMTLIQYTECRVRKEGETKDEKIFTACCMLVKEIDKEKESVSSNASDISGGSEVKSLALSDGPEAPCAYDIFISYAHKTPKEAHKFYENVQDIDSSLKVFLDRSELRTGNSWQEALYEAVDKARVVVAFISDSYISSTVCQEEYNIAVARFMISDQLYVLPLLTSESIKELPPMFSATPMIDISQVVFEEDHFTMAEAAVRWLHALRSGNPILNRFRLVQPRKKTRINFVTANWREKDFDARFEILQNSPHLALRSSRTAPEADPTNSSPKSVVFSFAHDCLKQATVLSTLLQKQGEGKISCEFLESMQPEGVQAPKLQLLDSADMVVLIVSDDYLESVGHQHELHITLCRQRMCRDQRVLYLIQSHHSKRKPVYAHLLHYSISLGDELWANLASKLRQDLTAVPVISPITGQPTHMYCSGGEYLALFAASLDIKDKLFAEKQDGGSGMPCNIVNLMTLKGTDPDPIPISEMLIPFTTLMDDRPSHEQPDGQGEKTAVSRTISSKQTVGGTPGKQAHHVVHSAKSCQIL